KSLLQAGKRTFEYTGKMKDGSEFPVEISTSTWEINNEIYLTAIIRDISKRKRIENEQVETLKKISVINILDRKISSSLDISEVYSTFAEEMRKLIDFNRIYIFSIKNNEIILETTEDFGISESRIDTENRIDLENTIAKLSISSLKTIIRNIDKPEISEDRIFYNDGIRSYICVPLITDKPVGLLYISSIEENAFSYEIIPLIEDLSIQLAIAIEKSNMYSELKKAYDELREVDELKNNIIANVRHEILTPVTVIKGNLEILEEDAESEECRNLLSTSKRYLRKLTDIVDDLVTISKFYRKDFKLNIKRVNLVSILEKALEERKTYAEEKNVDISKDIEDKTIEIEADERYLKKGIINLLDNAIKFNKAGGNVYVHISKNGDKAVIKISDTGIGIPKGKIDEIFYPLTQLDSTIKRKYGGTGSGLAVAKKIIEIHSGELRVYSEQDKGTTFELIIPLK
ncbi:MAG TPA: PAS domain S-box protein, partial [Euryarchaeota archaeon]|nr:PAS domain S-box protein [Euryarchaeota archaeon]